MLQRERGGLMNQIAEPARKGQESDSCIKATVLGMEADCTGEHTAPVLPDLCL